MANLTIAIDDAVLKRARMRALAQDTTVNALLRDFLIAYGEEDRLRANVERLKELRNLHMGSSGPEGRTWTRDDLYADRIHV